MEWKDYKWRVVLDGVQKWMSSSGVLDEAAQQDERGRWNNIPRWIEDLHHLHPIHTCLDIGCGPGTLSALVHELTGASCLGADVRVVLDNKVVDKWSIEFQQCDIEVQAVPVSLLQHSSKPASGWDLILLANVLEYFQYQACFTLDKLRQVLSPTGSIMVSTPDADDVGRLYAQYSAYSQFPKPDLPTKPRRAAETEQWFFLQTELQQAATDAKLHPFRFGYAMGAKGRNFNIAYRAACR